VTGHIVQFSGGITSWAAATLVVERYGTDDLVLLFADVQVEDEDLYRFNRDVEASIGVPLTVVADPQRRTPQQVFRDERFLGNSRIAPCSHLLKQQPARAWITANTDPADTILYVGLDWTETHRQAAVEKHWAPWRVEFPLMNPPYLDKRMWLERARAQGIEPPRLYRLGFPHNNCGGACVRGGQAQWLQLHRTFPDRYADWETFEQEIRDDLGDVSILRDRRGGNTRPLTLRVLREQAEGQHQGLFDPDDWGGCGCFTEPPAVTT
jgi:hypothetical protein